MDSFKDRLPASLATDRLLLTTPTLAHVPDIARLANNARVHQVMSRLPFPYTEDDARFFVEQVVPDPQERCYAILDGAGSFMGVVGLRFDADALPELGYWLGEPFWGHGYATEAASAVVAAARAAGIPALRSRALLTNTPSHNVLRKVGFSIIGEGTDKAGNLAGKPLALMRLEFAASRAAALPASVRTERLTLRAPALRDLPAIVALANNPKMVETTATLPFPFTDGDGRDFIAQAGGPGQRAWAIADADDTFMGTMLFKLVDGKHPEIGYWLGEPHWGQGYAAEALKGLLEAVRALPDFATINARVLLSNPASIRVLEKAGFAVTERTTSVVERHAGKPLLAMQWSAP
jgi:RimJ/RimL family protein N-acetyltransferase